MSDEYRFEEEEFSGSGFNGRTLLRVVAQLRPHWRWALGFLIAVAIVSALESYFTFLSKRIIDEGIIAGNREVLVSILVQYGLLMLVQAAAVFTFIYLTG